MKTILSLLLLAVCACGQSSAQSSWFNSYFPAPASGGYVGPADVVSGPIMWWGFRCVNTAYAGNVAEIWDAATGTTTNTILTCSAGGILNQTLNPLSTTCASGCVVGRVYDQSGNGATYCSPNCDQIQSTNASRPAFTQNYVSTGKFGMTFAGAQSMGINSPVGNAQPLTFSAVANRTATFTSQNAIVGSSGSSSTYLVFSTTTNQGRMYAGTNQNFPLTNTAEHAIQAVFNGASSSAYVDGTSTSVSPGTSGMVTLILGSDSGGTDFLTGTIGEVGLWAAAFSAGNQSAMNANQHAWYGF